MGIDLEIFSFHNAQLTLFKVQLPLFLFPFLIKFEIKLLCINNIMIIQMYHSRNYQKLFFDF
jgi:hypothetical protein